MKAGISRITLACEQCRGRKVRCNGQRPVCEPCIKQKIKCTFNETADKRKPYSKSFVRSLEARIAALEAELDKHRRDAGGKDGIGSQNAHKEKRDGSEAATASSGSGSDKGKERDTKSEDAEESHAVPQPDVVSSRPPETSSVGTEHHLYETMVRRGGCLSCHEEAPGSSNVACHFFGAASGRNIPVMKQCIARVNISDEQGHRYDVHDLQTIHLFSNAYVEHCQPLIGLQLERDLDRRLVQHQHASSITTDILLCAVCAVGALTCEDLASCQYFVDQANSLLGRETVHPRKTTVQALILMAYVESSLGCESRGWLYIGMASRISLEIGLPRDIHEYCRHGWIGAEEARDRHRTTWALFIVDRLVALYYGRFPSLIPESISNPMPSKTRALKGSISRLCPNEGGVADKKVNGETAQACATCETFEPSFVCLFELTTFSVDINARLYHNPMRSGEAASDWIDWASDMNLQLAKWHADLPRMLKCTFTRGQVPPPVALHLHITYHSLIVLLNRPFLALSAREPQARFAAHSCHTSSRAIVRLANQISQHFGFARAHNMITFALHASASIAVINAKLGTGTVQREARNDLLMLFVLLRQLNEVHKCATVVLSVLTDLVQAAFARDPFLDVLLAGKSSTGQVPAALDAGAGPEYARVTPPSAVNSSLSPSDVMRNGNGGVPDHSPFSFSSSPLTVSGNGLESDPSQFATVDWDLFAASTLSTVLDCLDVQPWLG